MRSMGSGLLLILFLATLPATSAHALTVFSTSDEMQVPQNISIAPPEFGELAGSFLVPDFGYGGNSESTGNVYVIPPNGGEAVVLANVGFAARGGIILPPGFKNPAGQDVGGQYLVVGSNDQDDARMVTVDASGNVTEYLTITDESYDTVAPFRNPALSVPMIVPDGFGEHAGKLMITAQSGGLIVFDQDGNYQQVFDRDADAPAGATIVPFGGLFAPEGFGDFEGKLLLSDALLSGDGVQIWAMDASGNFSLFAHVDLPEELVDIDAGLRQMTLVPADPAYGDLAGALLVSVAGSKLGGGELGQVLAFDSTGAFIKVLHAGSAFEAFDPRGLLVLADGRLLISDASDPIVVMQLAEFQQEPPPTGAIPEPATAMLGVLGLLATLRAATRRTAKVDR